MSEGGAMINKKNLAKSAILISIVGVLFAIVIDPYVETPLQRLTLGFPVGLITGFFTLLICPIWEKKR